MLANQISSARDELTGRGLFVRRKAKGDRAAYLEQSIERWKALLAILEAQQTTPNNRGIT